MKLYIVFILSILVMGCKGKGPTKKIEHALPLPTVSYNSIRLI